MNSSANRRGRERPPKPSLECSRWQDDQVEREVTKSSPMNSSANRRGRGQPPKPSLECSRWHDDQVEREVTKSSPMNSSTNRRGRGRPPKSSPESASTSRPSETTDSSYTKPPHPYESGILHEVNICPFCEKYTVKELDRNAVASDPSEEALRARFHCLLCENSFDIGIILYDPRGVPGVTLYKGEDRFVPPVPYRNAPPCPRCWTKSHTSFQCMTLYLKEDNHLPCEPSCPPDRLNPDLEKQARATIEKSKAIKKARTKRKSMRQVLKQAENVE